MKLLAIESSCDDTAAAVVEDGREILSSIVASQVERHAVFGGVVPEIASRMHIEAISGVVTTALEKAGYSLFDIDGVAVTHTPGLIGALLVGVNYAKGLALGANLPLIPVHHLRSHIAANYLTHRELAPPFLSLVVSGGHSHIIEVRDYTRFKVIGRTRDDAAGETLDKVARTLGLPYPGGLNLDREARGGDKSAYKFPHPKVSTGAYDFSFSGLKTAAVNAIHNASQKNEGINIADFGASFIASVVDFLSGNTESAANDLGYKKIVLAGGVSANSVLRERMKKICKRNGWELYMPELSLCGDNAAMVGSQGYFEFLRGNTADMSLNARASMEIG
ncbi:MAG: tRNA (adenosine(37)-N6)-threonylcarbamoyltransferase complex transferase subunit TsaD [Clostridiales bacterium]|jgi:N6-L-threonylcarbamoyladenine synthase|nr:tRNA (adenosine(37)-N6)-threonylcarbamoyltransferase complex transferase subunit TsaD [Clostridiales bacterium]